MYVITQKSHFHLILLNVSLYTLFHYYFYKNFSHSPIFIHKLIFKFLFSYMDIGNKCRNFLLPILYFYLIHNLKIITYIISYFLGSQKKMLLFSSLLYKGTNLNVSLCLSIRLERPPYTTLLKITYTPNNTFKSWTLLYFFLS